MDANLNRITEGLRVIEETVRFLFSDLELTEAVKKIRHSVAEAVKDKELYRNLLASRDSQTDVGASEKFDAKNVERQGLGDLMRANFQRAKESARTLEEFSKLPGLDLEKFKPVRFGLYELEKRIMLKYFSVEEKK